jgi:hypothetical protein
MRRVSSRSFMVGALLLGSMGGGQPARAQDDADLEEEQPAQLPQARVVFSSDEQFEQWFFPQPGGADRVRKNLESLLAGRIRAIDDRHGLNPDQKRKLEIAGRRDIHRYFEAIREKKEILRRPYQDMVAIRKILRDTQMLQMRRSEMDLFGETSLFGKTLKTIQSKRKTVESAKDVYWTKVDWVVSLSDERLSLSAEQHRRFVDLIVNETPPIEKYGEYKAYAVMVQASRLPEERFERILDEKQLRILRKTFRDMRGFERILIAQGYISAEGTDRNPAAVAEGQGLPLDINRQPRPLPFKSRD